MPNLLDTIRQNSSVLTQQPGMEDTTQQTAGLLRAKTGKQLAGSDVAQSNLGEQAATQQARTQMQTQVQPQAQLQQQGLEQQQAGIQQQAETQKQEIAQTRQFDTIQNRIKTDQVLRDMERQKGQVDVEQQKASMEQAGFNLRLQNQQYVDQLQLEGQKSRLDNENQFKQELTQSQLGANQKLLEAQLGNRQILDINENEFRKAMGNMNTDSAYQYFQNGMETERQRAIWSSVGGLGGAVGIGASKGMEAYQGQGSTSTGTTTGTSAESESGSALKPGMSAGSEAVL